MKVDWSTADVKRSADGGFSLFVTIVDVEDAEAEAFNEAAPHFGTRSGNEGRSVRRRITNRGQLGISMHGIDKADVTGERRRLDEFVAEVAANAAPRQAELDAERAERERKKVERKQELEDLTAQFRNGS